MVHHVQPAPTEEPRALGAVSARRPAQGATASLQRIRRSEPQPTPPKPPKIGSKGLTEGQKKAGAPDPQTYEERKHLLMLANKALSRIDTAIGPRANPDSLKAARWEWYQSIQPVVQQLGIYARFNATHVSNISDVRFAIQELGQQVDAFGTLVLAGGTESQFIDAYNMMRRAAKDLLPMLY